MKTKKLRLEWLDPKSLQPNPHNWRKHPEQQKKILNAVLSEVGWAGVALHNETTGRLIDGHARRDWAIAHNEATMPVLVGAWSEADEKKLLATLDPIAAMAEQADAIYKELLAWIETENQDLARWAEDLLQSMADKAKGPVGTSARPQIIKAATLDDLAPTDEERAVIAGKKICLEFSGGKDSSASAIWAKHHFPANELDLMFCDMGADFTGFHLFLNQFAKFISAPLVVLRTPSTIIDIMLAKKDWPMFIGPYCHQPLHSALNAHVKKHAPNRCIAMRGGRAAEKARSGKTQKTRLIHLESNKDYQYFQPLYFAHKDVSESILAEVGAPIWEGYSFGLKRTACRICPGQKPLAYAAIRRNFPHVWRELLALEKLFGPGAWQRRTGGCARPFNELADLGDTGDEGEELAAQSGS